MQYEALILDYIIQVLADTVSQLVQQGTLTSCSTGVVNSAASLINVIVLTTASV